MLQLQLIDRDSYGRTIARCQFAFHLPEMIAFTYPNGKLANCILLVGEKGREPQKFQDDSLDFNQTKTVLAKKQLYAFKDGNPVTAYKIAAFPST